MQMTIVPGFRDLFGEPKIPYEEWLKDIPSDLGALVAITMNRELDLSHHDQQVQFELMKKIVRRFSQEQKVHVTAAFQQYRNRTNGKYQNDFFERWYLLEMVTRELNRNAIFNSIEDGPQQEYNFLMAYSLLIDEAHSIQGVMARAASESIKDHLFPYRMLWTAMIYQFQFQERPDPSYELYKLASILLYASDKYRLPLREYLHGMGFKSIGQLIGSFHQIVQGAIRPGEDLILPSLKYYNPLPGVNANHLRASAINLNLPKKVKTSDLRKFPMFYKQDKGYVVIDQGFYFKKLYRGTQFDLRSKSTLGKEMDGGVYNSDIAEYVLEKMCFKSILSSMKENEWETLTFDDRSANSPDAFHEYKTTDMLFEFKGYMFPDSLLEKPSFETFKAYIDDRLVQKEDGRRKGVSQLAFQIDLMAKGKAPWFRTSAQGKQAKKRQIFPVLCFDDFYFTMPGVNEYLNQVFQEKLSPEAKAKFDIMPVTLINLDILFFLSVRKANFSELKDFIIRYWKIIKGRANKYRKSGSPDDLLSRMASFDNIFHTLMVGDLAGRLPIAPMTVLLKLGNITQDVLDGKKKKQRVKITVDDQIPLRGFLICPRCGRMLTGSGSKGRKLRYYYYHCSSTCGIRYRADLANREFIREIKKYIPHPAALELHKKVIREGYEYQMKDQKENRKRLIQQVSELNNRIVRARDLLLSGDIEATDFRTIKMDCEKQITILEAKLHSTWGDGAMVNQVSTTRERNIISTANENDTIHILDKAVNNLANLDSIYLEATTIKKRQIVGSMFPEKLTFDGQNFRIAKLNEAVRLIYTLDTAFREKENGTSDTFINLSHLVNPMVQMSNCLTEDLKRLANLLAA